MEMKISRVGFYTAPCPHYSFHVEYTEGVEKHDEWLEFETQSEAEFQRARWVREFELNLIEEEKQWRKA